jgi:hypothetical protein
VQWIRDVVGLIAFFLFLFLDTGALGLLIFESIKKRFKCSRNFEDNAVKDSQSHDQKPTPLLPRRNERVNWRP